MCGTGSRELHPDIVDVFGPLPLGRANSALEVPPAQSLSSPLPYMPQWQSESVPAELPNHVVNRLLMSGNHDLQQRGPWYIPLAISSHLLPRNRRLLHRVEQ